MRGLGIEDGAEAFEQDQNTSTPAREALAKLNQIVQVRYSPVIPILVLSVLNSN